MEYRHGDKDGNPITDGCWVDDNKMGVGQVKHGEGGWRVRFLNRVEVPLVQCYFRCKVVVNNKPITLEHIVPSPLKIEDTARGKTICPYYKVVVLANPRMDGKGYSDCDGPLCQQWEQCCRTDQCPKCGTWIDEPNSDCQLCINRRGTR